MSQFSYFYTDQAEKFAFYRIPKSLFTDERFSALSTDAKLLAIDILAAKPAIQKGVKNAPFLPYSQIIGRGSVISLLLFK